MARGRQTRLPPPYLRRIWLSERDPGEDVRAGYPFDLPLFRPAAFELGFDRPVTIIVGENGVGKSTLLEAIAVLAGYDESGGGPGYSAVDNSRARETGGGSLASALKASWLPKIGYGWFFRAETFFSVARYLDEVGSRSADFLSHSHGEGFTRFFAERLTQPGLFILDEPETALSPVRQFDFLKLLAEIEREGKTQIIMATHSPILMAHRSARLLEMTNAGIWPTDLEATGHFRLMREFFADPRATVQAMTGDPDA